MRTYSVQTWDTERQLFTPQDGVPAFGLSLYQLRQSMRLLQRQGYSCDRNKAGSSDPWKWRRKGRGQMSNDRTTQKILDAHNEKSAIERDVARYRWLIANMNKSANGLQWWINLPKRNTFVEAIDSAMKGTA